MPRSVALRSRPIAQPLEPNSSGLVSGMPTVVGSKFNAIGSPLLLITKDWLLGTAKNSGPVKFAAPGSNATPWRSEEHTSELQSRPHLVCRLLLEKKKKKR